MIFLDSTLAVQLIVLVILIMLSAFFSSAETAFMTVNKIRIRNFEEKGRKNASKIRKLIDNPQKLLSAVLIGNNIVNLSASSLMTIAVTRLLTNLGMGDKVATGVSITTGILTLIILIFGEVTPKNLATRRAEKLCFLYVHPIYALTILFTPIAFIINSISNGLMFLLGMRKDDRESTMTESELRTIIYVSHEEGVIENEEKEMISNVVDFGDSMAKDVMIPRIDVSFVPSTASYKEVFNAFKQDMYSRMPVYEESKDNVIGILNLKDFFTYEGRPEDFRISDYLRKPFFTYEYQKTSELLVQMKTESFNFAIVLDEYGATSGIITLEDLLEEIVGEIRDEYDVDEEDEIIQLRDGEYMVDGGTKLEDINEAFGCHIESDDYDSIAGHIINVLEHIPAEGEQIRDGHIRFVVEAMDKNRIDKIHVYLEPSSDEA